jgi:predicted nucleotidyltransferase
MIHDRDAILRLLAAHKEELARRFQVRDIALFGSAARGSAREGGDIDILVGFDGPATSARYFGLQFFLEDLLGCPVDLVTDKALRPELRPFIEKEALHV